MGIVATHHWKLGVRGPLQVISEAGAAAAQPAAPAIARCTTERRMPQAEAWQLKERRATIQQRAVRHNIKGAPHKGAAAMSP